MSTTQEQEIPRSDLSNWRQRPFSKRSFQHVRELVPVSPIKAPVVSQTKLAVAPEQLGNLIVPSPDGTTTLDQLLESSCSDALLVVHGGRKIFEWHAPHFDPVQPHILFSISKSVTAILAGILEDQGVIQSDMPVTHYLPGAKNSAYGNCTLRNLLDMTVALDFEENYTDPESEYMLYRQATAWNPVDQDNPGPALEEFLYSLRQSQSAHGDAFLYRSPNSDLLGLALERASGQPFADLLASHLWQPAGMARDGYVTVDRCGAARAAGGICISLDDFARIGQLFIDNGEAMGKQVLTSRWIEDTMTNGDRQAWLRGNYAQRMPDGKYRNKWYQSGDQDGTLTARGIHGQQLYINPKRSTVIARFSSHPDPLNDAVTDACLGAFQKIALELG
jgi:CubicO group peptidase (beta-lactamase class C family)